MVADRIAAAIAVGTSSSWVKNGTTWISTSHTTAPTSDTNEVTRNASHRRRHPSQLAPLAPTTGGHVADEDNGEHHVRQHGRERLGAVDDRFTVS